MEGWQYGSALSAINLFARWTSVSWQWTFWRYFTFFVISVTTRRLLLDTELLQFSLNAEDPSLNSQNPQKKITNSLITVNLKILSVTCDLVVEWLGSSLVTQEVTRSSFLTIYVFVTKFTGFSENYLGKINWAWLKFVPTYWSINLNNILFYVSKKTWRN